jgi:hypothetical protein
LAGRGVIEVDFDLLAAALAVFLQQLNQLYLVVDNLQAQPTHFWNQVMSIDYQRHGVFPE